MPTLKSKSKVVFGRAGGKAGDGGKGGKGGGEGGGVGGQGVVQSALAAIESTPTVTTASNSLLIVHTWMAMAAPAISYDSPSPSVIQSSDGTLLR
eukprot:scaffold20156_cov43-Phaeocystis_antarctica.AAC.2